MRWPQTGWRIGVTGASLHHKEGRLKARDNGGFMGRLGTTLALVPSLLPRGVALAGCLHAHCPTHRDSRESHPYLRSLIVKEESLPGPSGAFHGLPGPSRAF